jgi:phenylacetate-CoA ligase
VRTGLKEYALFLGKSLHFSAKGLLVRLFKQSKSFYEALAELEASQWYSPLQYRELQEKKLRALIAHAYEHVPYYNTLFTRHGIAPQHIQGLDDLKKIPILTKETLRSNPNEFIAKNINRRSLFPGWTTGTTGAPINVLRTRASIAYENAILWRQRRWAGADLSCRRVAVWGTIWNNVIVPASVTHPPFWRYNLAENQLLLSYFHMSEQTLPLYFEKLGKFKPQFIEGFPSTLLTLAQFLERHDSFFDIPSTFTSSEPLYEVHRRQIEDRFRSKIFDHYGQAERVVAAQECPAHNGLHILPEYGILELIKNGRDAKPGDSGEIIGTGLINYAMPLIRYRTGDAARLAEGPCPCGRNMPLLHSIEGRSADRIVTPDGRIIPGDGLMGAFHGVSNIQTSQVVQEDLDHIIVRVVKDKSELAVDGEKLSENLSKCLGKAVKVRIEFVDTIPDGERGKHRWVVSRIAQAHDKQS